LKHLEQLLFNNPELTGFNVTIPYKISILPFLDEIDEEAREIGAVNTVKIYRDQQRILLKGYNTDGIGFLQSLPDPFPHRKALILGTGGASRAVARALKKLGITYKFVSRSKSGEGFLSYEELGTDLLNNYTLVVNTTPAGMFPDADRCPDLPYHLLTKQHFLYDLVYNPEETLFLKKGKERGAQTINGYKMLIGQAEAAYRIFTSAPPP
jgi:shikimate dehydrogenase